MEREYVKLSMDTLENLYGKTIMFKEPLEFPGTMEQDERNPLFDEHDPMFFMHEGKRYVKPNYPVVVDYGLYSTEITVNGWGYLLEGNEIEVSVVKFVNIKKIGVNQIIGKKIAFKEPFLYCINDPGDFEDEEPNPDPMFIEYKESGYVYVRQNYPVSVTCGSDGWPELNGWSCLIEDPFGPVFIAIIEDAEEPKPVRYCVVWSDQDGVFRVTEAESKEAAVRMLEQAHENALSDPDFVDFEELDSLHTKSYVAYRDDTFVRTQVIDMD